MKKIRILMPVVAILFAFVGAFASALVKPADQTRVDVSKQPVPCEIVGTCIPETGPICQDFSGNDLWIYANGTCPSKIQGKEYEEE